MDFKAVTRAANGALFFLKKHIDLIEFVGGGVCIGIGTVQLIRDSEKIADARATAQNAKVFKKETDEEVKKSGSTWKEEVGETRGHYIRRTATDNAINYTKASWKGLAWIGAGEVLQSLGYKTVVNRYNATSTLLAASTLAFSNYRKNVVADQGIEKDQEYMNGDKLHTVEVKKDGTVVQKDIPLNAGNPNRPKIHEFWVSEMEDFSDENGYNGNLKVALDQLVTDKYYVNSHLEIHKFIFENKIREILHVKRMVVTGQCSGAFYQEPNGSINKIDLFVNGRPLTTEYINDILAGAPDDVLVEIKYADGRSLEPNMYKRMSEFGWAM